ncbi:MAG: ThiF family adenylyltransferase [Nevskiaceae bacterium]|jgi:molybdopterin/thiamine biosynthesis adenylyltransferase|nr:ThiF family adenylyltransferase [Nevskiaceae bacterium]
MTTPFDYDAMTTRNIGFLTPDEQAALRRTRVFVCGTGGMGGACLQSIVRAGVERLIIADMDSFELSNLNRQVFAALADVGHDKADVTRRKLLDINPQLQLEVHGAEWVDHLDQILADCKIIVNGMDDVAAGIHLYRKAREHGATVIDAYSAPLPSVTVVAPSSPRPEERLEFGTAHLHWRQIDKHHVDRCKLQEMLYVAVNSSSIHHFKMQYAAEVFAGKRSRPSLAPMVITTGNLMAFEVLRLMTGRAASTDCRGYFFNPWDQRVERPRRGLSRIVANWYARRRLASLMHEGGE